MTIVDCAAVELFVICILLGWILGLYSEMRLMRRRLRGERDRLEGQRLCHAQMVEIERMGKDALRRELNALKARAAEAAKVLSEP